MCCYCTTWIVNVFSKPMSRIDMTIHSLVLWPIISIPCILPTQFCVYIHVYSCVKWPAKLLSCITVVSGVHCTCIWTFRFAWDTIAIFKQLSSEMPWPLFVTIHTGNTWIVGEASTGNSTPSNDEHLPFYWDKNYMRHYFVYL